MSVIHEHKHKQCYLLFIAIIRNDQNSLNCKLVLDY